MKFFDWLRSLFPTAPKAEEPAKKAVPLEGRPKVGLEPPPKPRTQPARRG